MITIVRRSKKRVSVFQWILATALFTVSCTTDVWNETEDDANAICFQAPQTESRAAVEGSSLPANSSFLVWGGYDNNVTNVFDGETVSGFGGVWNYEGGTRYWIPGKTYSFYGVYPKLENVSTITVDDEGVFSILNFNSSQSVDLMTASSPTMYGSSPETVKLSFNHELAWVELIGMMDAASVAAIPGFKVEVTAVSIYGMPVVADFVSGVWSSSQTPTDEITPFKSISGDPVQLSETKETSLLGDLLFVPQKITDKFCISITYKVYSSTNTNGSEITQTIPLATLGVEEWNKSIHYQYRFTISDTEHILFDRPEVAPWTDATGGTIVVE